jgi:hypothetical protein
VRDRDRETADRERERAADRPQDGDERHGRERGGQEPAHEIDRRLGGETQVIGDAILRILVIAADQIELEISAAGEPSAQQLVVEPSAPGALHGHADIHGDDADHEISADHDGKDQGFGEKTRGVLRLERVEEVPVPHIDPIGDRQADQHHGRHAERERPGAARPAPPPIADRARPEAAEQAGSMRFRLRAEWAARGAMINHLRSRLASCGSRAEFRIALPAPVDRPARATARQG